MYTHCEDWGYKIFPRLSNSEALFELESHHPIKKLWFQARLLILQCILSRTTTAGTSGSTTSISRIGPKSDHTCRGAARTRVFTALFYVLLWTCVTPSNSVSVDVRVDVEPTRTSGATLAKHVGVFGRLNRPFIVGTFPVVLTEHTDEHTPGPVEKAELSTKAHGGNITGSGMLRFARGRFPICTGLQEGSHP